MGVQVYSTKVISNLPPAKAFKALVLDFHSLAPKAAPQVIHSVDHLEGNHNCPGSIKQIKFAEGRKYKIFKQRVDEVDHEKLIYKFTIIDGDVIRDGIEKIETEIKIEGSPEGGSILQGCSKYYTNCDAKLNHEEIKAGKENSAGLFKYFESYLLANPQA